MSTVTILHLSDLHYSTGQSTNISIIKEALLRDLSTLGKDLVVPDIAIFSGDLVFAGENNEAFTNVTENFLNPVLEALKLKNDKLFIAPGNHDISRKQVRSLKYVDDGLRGSLTTVDKINEFIDETISCPTQNTVALDRLSSFESFQGRFGGKPITSNPFVRTYLARVADATIGVGCFNTAWRATGEPDDVDRGRLILGERAVDLAIADLTEANLRVAVFHHPPYWLLDCDASAVDARLSAQFDILCTGHIHESKPQLAMNPTGTCLISQAGCLYQTRKYFNGYQLLRLDLDTGEVEIFVRTYYDAPRRTFDKALGIYPEGYHKFRLEPRLNTPQAAHAEEVLRRIRSYIRDKANQHFSMVRGNDPRLHDIRALFQVPPLGVRPELQISYKTDEKIDKYYRNLDDVLRGDSNVLFFGQREAGKTSLAHFVAVKVSEGLSDKPRVPIVFDAKNFRRVRDLRRLARTYLADLDGYEDLISGLEKCELLMIVDNFSLTDRTHVTALEKFRSAAPSIRWICLIDEDSAALVHSPELPSSMKEFQPLFIHNLPRRAIRKISQNWCEVTGGDGEKAFSAVMQHIAHAQLPKTGYIVSLLLWAMHQKQRFERINEALLLEHIIEYLLEKTDLSGLLRREFGFRAKEIVLRHIACFLRDNGDLVPVNELLVSVVGFFQTKGLNFNADDVVRSFIECGILVKDDENIRFKYRCFQEYFIAGLLREDRDYLTGALQSDRFLTFRRELELMSGLAQQCDELLEFLQATLKEIEPDSTKGQELGGFSRLSVGEHAVVVARLRQREITKVEISEEQIDDLWDYAEQKWSTTPLNEMAEENELNEEDKAARSAAIELFNYLASIDLYGRVLKNLEFADKRDKITHLTAFLNHWTRVTLFIMNEVEKSMREVVEKKIGDFHKMGQQKLSDLDYRLSTLAPILASLVIENQVGTEKLIPIIEELAAEAASPDLVAFFCAALLLELKAESWVTEWRKLRDKFASKNNRLAISVLIERLWVFYKMHPLGREQRSSLANLIGDLRISLGMRPAEKPALISRIERRGIIRNAENL